MPSDTLSIKIYQLPPDRAKVQIAECDTKLTIESNCTRFATQWTRLDDPVRKIEACMNHGDQTYRWVLDREEVDSFLSSSRFIHPMLEYTSPEYELQDPGYRCRCRLHYWPGMRLLRLRGVITFDEKKLCNDLDS